MSGRDKQSSHPSALASSRPRNQTVENTAARSSALKRDYMKGVIPAIILNTSACEIPHFFFFQRDGCGEKDEKAGRQKTAGLKNAGILLGEVVA